jgi:hypothetical protein
MTKPETPSIPSDTPIKRATAPKASTGKAAPKATITVNPEGLGWVVRLGREFLRDAQGVIQTYATAGEAKREVLTWRPIAPSIAARQRGSRRVKRREEL